jgi:hypothetical protein
VAQSDPKHSGWGASKISWRQRNAEVLASATRLSMLMEMPPESALHRDGAQKGNKQERKWEGHDAAAVLALQQSRYGLGDRRTLSQAIEFSGIDTRNRTMVGNRCGNLAYVPFAEHPWGPEYIPQFNATSEAFIDLRDPGSIYYDPDDRKMVEAWMKADELHRKGQRHISQDPSAGVPLHLSAIAKAVGQLARERTPVNGDADTAAGGNDILAQAMEHKAAVNIVCLLLIALIIAARLCVANRYRISKVAHKYLAAGETSTTTVKEV